MERKTLLENSHIHSTRHCMKIEKTWFKDFLFSYDASNAFLFIFLRIIHGIEIARVTPIISNIKVASTDDSKTHLSEDFNNRKN